MTKSKKVQSQQTQTHSTSKTSKVALKSHVISITLPCELYEWSETLTFDQISDTLFAIDLFVNNDDHSMFSPKDLETVQNWMERNDFMKFVQAKELALVAHNTMLENEIFAREISNMPLRIPRSH